MSRRSMPSVVERALAGLVICLLATPAVAGDFELFGRVSLTAVLTEGPSSWLEGGFGRLSTSGGGAKERETTAVGVLALGIDWRPVERFRLHLHGTARDDVDGVLGREPAGLLEAYVEGSLGRVPGAPGGRLHLRAGHFFLPTSQENVDRLWSSPYTLTLSALNSWIGEELRPTGLDTAFVWTSGNGREVSLAATIFGGNDSAGALLAWRGLSLGDRRTVWGEVLPLPPLDSLTPGGGFAPQRDDGTRPFGTDLDHRPGWSARLGFESPDRYRIQATHLDSRGDRGLHGGEYAWDTELDLVGGHLYAGRHLELLGEVALGSSGMGPGPPAFVDLDFEVGYLLASWRLAAWRLSVRYDRFSIEDLDGSAAGERNDEEGEAWTAALLWEKARWRIGLELLDLDADRPAAAESGFDPDTDGRSARFEVRFHF